VDTTLTDYGSWDQHYIDLATRIAPEQSFRLLMEDLGLAVYNSFHWESASDFLPPGELDCYALLISAPMQLKSDSNWNDIVVTVGRHQIKLLNIECDYGRKGERWDYTFHLNLLLPNGSLCKTDIDGPMPVGFALAEHAQS
jgi:hypothetical protein